MITISKALEVIERETTPLSLENINLESSIGRILAVETFADMDLPPFDRSQMDGFAIKTSDTTRTPVRLKIVGESVAGKRFGGELRSGEAVRIMTGAPVPENADAVQKVELTREENHFIEILEAAKIGQNINRRASEIEKGAKIFSAGEIITENMIAALASFGYAKVAVGKRPKVGIISTGSEIVEISETPQTDQIRNSNSAMLQVFVSKFADAEVLPPVRDDAAALASAIKNAAKKFDVVITTGGVSVGDYDFTKPVLRELGAEIFFEKVSLRPGKPTVFAKLANALVFGLPGNPVSVAVTFHLFAQFALLKMQNAQIAELTRGYAILTEKIKAAKERDSYLPVSVETNKKGKLIVESLRFSGSSNFIQFARANALLFVPQDESLEAGDVGEIVFL